MNSLLGTGITLLVMLTVLLLDIVLPRSISGALLYGYVALVALWGGSIQFALVIACICSGLTVAGYWFNPDEQVYWKAIINRGLALATIWTIFYLGVKQRQLTSEKELGKERAAK